MRLAVTILAAATAACAPSISAQDTEAGAPFDALVDVGGVTLQYRDWGGDGPLMVLLPSLGMTAHSFENLAPFFTDRFRVMGLTRRWHGASEQAGLDFDLDSLANDLGAFVEMFTDEPAVIVGWGSATLEQATLARNRPDLVAGLILLNGVLVPLAPPEGVGPPPGQFAPDSVYANLEVAVDTWAPYLHVDRPVLRELLSAALIRREDGKYVPGPPVGTPALRRFFELEDWSPRMYEGINAPVLVIQVRQARYLAADLQARGFPPDSVSAAERWAIEYDDVMRNRGVERLVAVLPTAEVVILEGVSHNFVLEAPGVVADPVREFLSRTVL